MKKETKGKKKKWLLKAIGICFLAAAGSVIFVFWYAYYSRNTQAYKEIEQYITQQVADKVGKDPDELTKEDFGKVTEIRGGLYRSPLKPLAKLKNLEKITFLVVNQNIDANLDFRPLAKLSKLREISIEQFYANSRTPPPKKWYDGILSIIHKSKQSASQSDRFDLGKLNELKNLEIIDLGSLPASNFEALMNLKNLKQVRLSMVNLHDEEIARLYKVLPELKKAIPDLIIQERYRK